jgi:hypothetical protein
MTKRHNANRDDGHLMKRKCERQDDDRKQRIKFSPKDTPGVICIERQLHNEAVVISGSLTVEHDAPELKAWIEEELETAARSVKESGGAAEQIKAAITVNSTSVLTISDEKAMDKEPPKTYAQIMMAAIISRLDPKEAETIVRKALASVRAKMREKHPAKKR